MIWLLQGGSSRLLTTGMRVNVLFGHAQRERMRQEWDAMAKLVKESDIKLE